MSRVEITTEGELVHPFETEGIPSQRDRENTMSTFISTMEVMRKDFGNFCLTVGIGKYKTLIFSDTLNNSHHLAVTRYGLSILYLDNRNDLDEFDKRINKAARGSGRIIPFSHRFNKSEPEFTFLHDFESPGVSYRVHGRAVESEYDLEKVEEFFRSLQEKFKNKTEVVTKVSSLTQETTAIAILNLPEKKKRIRSISSK